MKRPILKYIGKQYLDDTIYFPLWNIFNSPRPDLHPNGSAISKESLKEMGIVK